MSDENDLNNGVDNLKGADSTQNGSDEGAGQDITSKGKENSNAGESLEEYKERIAQMEKRNSELMSLYNKEQNRAKQFEDKLKGYEKPPEEPDYKKPGWEPKTYDDLGKAISTAEERAAKIAIDQMQAKQASQEEAKKKVDEFIGTIKKSDKEFNDTHFFKMVREAEYPVKTIEDLQKFYDKIYTKIRIAEETGEKNAKKNIQTRAADTVNAGKDGEGSKFSMPYNERRKYSSISEAAQAAFNKLKT